MSARRVPAARLRPFAVCLGHVRPARARAIEVFEAGSHDAMRVFLSHSSADKPAVRRIKRALEPHGPVLWLDECELLPADSLFGKIQSAIEDSDCVLAFISKDSVRSRWVQEELQAFLARERSGARPMVIPVLLDDAEPPPFLASRIQVRTTDRPFGDVIRDLLKGILRTHAVLRLRPLQAAPYRLEPFSDEIDALREQASAGALHTVFEVAPLAEALIAAGETIPPHGDHTLVDEHRILIPRTFDVLSAIAPRLVQVVLAAMGNDATAPLQAERVLQLVWRIVTLTWIHRVFDDRRNRECPTLPYDLPAAVHEWRGIADDPHVFDLRYGIRPAVWLRHHGVELSECRDFGFEGRQREDGTRFYSAYHVWIPPGVVPSQPTLVPSHDFMPWDWQQSVLPLIAANAVIDRTFFGTPIAELRRNVGLAPEDYARYGPS